MADHLSPEKRSWNMSHIKSKDTAVEVKVRSCLFRNGFRFRKNVSSLPGKPDIVLPKYKTVIFVHGCFWHGHNSSLTPDPSPKGKGRYVLESSECCKIPKTNREFWVDKIRRNKERDKEEQKKLAAMGWHCITVWECELKPSVREQTLDSIAFTLNHIWLQDHSLPQPYESAEEELPMVAEE